MQNPQGTRSVLATLLAIACLLIGIRTLMAAEASAWRIHGFSADGRYFAFSEYGIHDGTGAPYVNFFMLDMEEDRFLPPTPLRTRFGEVSAPLRAAFKRLHPRIRNLLARHRINDPGVLLAARAITQADGEGYSLVFYPNINLATRDHRVEYRLDLLNLPARGVCRQMDNTVRGFRLRVRIGEGAWRVAHADARIPASRGCPVNYALAAVVAPAEGDPRRRQVALIYVFRQGFEGLDAHLIAVPVLF